VYFGLSAQLEYLKNLNPISDDPSNLRNQLETIDWVYMEAKGGAFKVYSFVPSIYDHNYHYLFWWYGTKTYGYQPSEVAYLPDQPEYIQDEGVLWNKTKTFTDQSSIFLIIENKSSERFPGWNGQFVKLCPEKEITFPFPLTAVKLNTCTSNK